MKRPPKKKPAKPQPSGLAEKQPLFPSLESDALAAVERALCQATQEKRRVAYDLETYDPDLRAKGPGARRDGYVVGAALAIEGGGSWYLPVRHEAGANLNAEKVFALLRGWGSTFSGDLVGTHLLYDLEYSALEKTGPVLFPRARFLDVQHAEPLIDETRQIYGLDDLSWSYLGHGKNLEDVNQALARLPGGASLSGDPQSHLWRLPGDRVAAYALGDVRDPLEILRLQEKRLEEDQLQEVWDLETRLLPMVLAMRLRGVPIDKQRALRVRREVTKRVADLKTELKRLTGRDIRPMAVADIAPYLEAEGFKLPRTPTTDQPSVTKPWLERHQQHPGVGLYLRLRQWDKVINTFIDGHVLGSEINGRVYPSIHQLRDALNGTVTGRFSYSLPNLQQLSARNEEIAPVVRGCFVPEPGELWHRDDLSQIEYRYLVHYARGRGAAEARQKYLTDPKMSFHVLAADLAGMDHRHEPTYKKVKNTNFCKVYGGGAAKIAETAGITVAEATAFVATYDRELPFVKETFQWVDRVAQQRGWVRSIDGRRHRFTKWEPADWKLSRLVLPLSDRNAALREVRECQERLAEDGPESCGLPPGYRIRNGVRRAKTWHALNRLLQGGAAGHMKKAMVLQWESGLCGVIGPPLVTVHDEEGWSADKTKAHQAAVAEAKHLLESAFTLTVPVTAERKVGKSWGAVK